MVLMLRLLQKARTRVDPKGTLVAAPLFAAAALTFLAAVLLVLNSAAWGSPHAFQNLLGGGELCPCLDTPASVRGSDHQNLGERGLLSSQGLQDARGLDKQASDSQGSDAAVSRLLHPQLQPLQNTPPWKSSLVVVPAVFREWEAGWPQWTGEFTVHLYQRTNASAPNYCQNTGYESSLYLKFIVDHYYNLPDVTAFIHAKPEEHQPEFQTWLRCLNPNLTYTSLNAPNWLKHWNIKHATQAYESVASRFDCQVPRIEQCFRNFAAIFGKKLTAPGEEIKPSFYCCNQFVISRDYIWRYPLRVYQEAYKLIGLNERCVDGPIDPRESWSLQDGFCVEEPKREWFTEGHESKVLQAMPMEYLSHHLFNGEELDSEPYTQEHFCRNFRSADECPGSPCEGRAAVQ